MAKIKEESIQENATRFTDYSFKVRRCLCSLWRDYKFPGVLWPLINFDIHLIIYPQPHSYSNNNDVWMQRNFKEREAISTGTKNTSKLSSNKIAVTLSTSFLRFLKSTRIIPTLLIKNNGKHYTVIILCIHYFIITIRY